MVNGEKFQSHAMNDLDLDWTMPNVEFARAIFIYYNMFKFQVDFFLVIVYTDRHTDWGKCDILGEK